MQTCVRHFQNRARLAKERHVLVLYDSKKDRYSLRDADEFSPKTNFSWPFFTRECNETSIAGSQKALTRSLDFVKYFIYGNYNVSYYNAADQCIRLLPW